MQNGLNNLRDTQDQDRQSYYPADQTPRREGGDDSLAEASPHDPRDDEKVIINNPRAQKKVDTSSQTASNTSEQ